MDSISHTVDFDFFRCDKCCDLSCSSNFIFCSKAFYSVPFFHMIGPTMMRNISWNTIIYICGRKETKLAPKFVPKGMPKLNMTAIQKFMIGLSGSSGFLFRLMCHTSQITIRWYSMTCSQTLNNMKCGLLCSMSNLVWLLKMVPSMFHLFVVAK